ncbi:MAG: molybdopterin molybdotransferase MoeA [Candidatus Bathyarchaeia archaeon]
MARLKGFRKLVSVEEALQLFLSKVEIKRLSSELVPLRNAYERVLAEDIVAEDDLPRFDRSAVDGFAVKAEDTLGASIFRPKTLKVIEGDELGKGEAKQIWTGTPIPKGADSVLMLENVRQTENTLEVWTAITPGENVSKKGEDLKKDEVAVKAGTRLKPQHIGLIASLGRREVNVVKKPIVAFLATGNELVEVGETLRYGQVFEVNRLIIWGLCNELGAEPIDLGIARDDVEEISRKIKHRLEKVDILITTGGTSVGGLDLVPQAINNIGNPGIVVHGVAMRPAMPTSLAIVNGKPIVILSGNPVAAFFGFEVFARPLILKMLGASHETRPAVMARLTRRVTTALGRKTFVRVRAYYCNGEFLAEPISSRGSGIITTLTKANGYVVVPENREGLEKGEEVQVHLFDTLEGGLKCSGSF